MLQQVMGRLHVLNRFFYYQIAHDPEFGELSPGKVILHEVIRHYCDLGYKEFNFLQGDEDGNVDVLESGIEIIAKPPGKELRSIKFF